MLDVVGVWRASEMAVLFDLVARPRRATRDAFNDDVRVLWVYVKVSTFAAHFHGDNS